MGLIQKCPAEIPNISFIFHNALRTSSAAYISKSSLISQTHRLGIEIE